MNSIDFSTRTFKNELFKVNENTFEDRALKLFNYQYQNVPIYRDFVDYIGTDVSMVTSLLQIPFLPIQFFKSQTVLVDNVKVQKVFESSGTTGSQTSKHYFDDVDFYLKNCENIFQNKYGSIKEFVVLALLPSYIERGNSSLTAMCDHFIKQSKFAESGFYLYDFKQLAKHLNQISSKGCKVLLLGVTFALLDLAEKIQTKLPDNFVIMETGGMKGRREEMTRTEIHEILRKSFGVSSIHSEYGMTELNSQLYSSDNGFFTTPNWVNVFCRDINDPLSVGVKNGPINIVDLANVNSCAFIATDDLGEIKSNGEIKIMGRIDNSDTRGCNLLVI